MGRYTFPAFKTSRITRYLVLWGLQWQVLDREYLEPGADLSGAMAAAIDRLASEGWQAEGGAECGFVFIRRGTERRLLMALSGAVHLRASPVQSPLFRRRVFSIGTLVKYFTEIFYWRTDHINLNI